MRNASPQKTEALIIGAGPVGLFQAFQLGLQEIGCHIIDALPHVGGQCVELYAEKPIYDLPGIPACSGQALVQSLVQQISPFQVPLHLRQQVLSLQAHPEGGWLLSTDQQQHFWTQTVFIAAGVGAFVPRRVPLAALTAFENTQVHYHHIPATTLQQQHVVVMGGEEAALDTVLELANSAACASLTLLHRSPKFRVAPAQEQSLHQAIAAGKITLRIGQPVGIRCDTQPSCLSGLEIATTDEQVEHLPADVLLPRLGLSPKLGPIADWGLEMERKLLVVDPATQATSASGIYAVGDICHYPNKRKLLLTGFHEATMAAFAAAAWLRPHERHTLQYTTTSPHLQQLLGV